jgi:hypothetical protein
MQTVSEGFSRTTDLSVIFVCCLVTPTGKKYSGAIARPSRFPASMEAMWQHGIDTLAKVFSYNVTEMIGLFQDYLYHPRQFDSVKDRYSNDPQLVSVAGQMAALNEELKEGGSSGYLEMLENELTQLKALVAAFDRMCRISSDMCLAPSTH